MGVPSKDIPCPSLQKDIIAGQTIPKLIDIDVKWEPDFISHNPILLGNIRNIIRVNKGA
jgi:hypothetical protein